MAADVDNAVFPTPPPDRQRSSTPPLGASPALTPLYRPIAQLPYELATHCSVFLESGQYLEGFALLHSLLKARTSISTPSHRHPSFVPPVQVFELAATLIVHPAVTTRASSSEKLRAANEAINYLRAVNRIVGPVNANFNQAFTFPQPGSGRSRSGRRRDVRASSVDADAVDDDRPIRSALANEAGLWAQADDFWKVVGWSFNCSIKHKARWARWKVWLELMLEIMEADWAERCRLQAEAVEKDGFADGNILVQSIIAIHLIATNAGALSQRRRILRSILADGSAKALGEFDEVFKNELKERKEEVVKPIRQANFQKGDFGDLDINEDEDEDLTGDEKRAGTSTRLRTRKAPEKRRPSIISLHDSSSDDETINVGNASSGASTLGDPEAVELRQRFLALLATVALALPTHFTTREQLFDTYTEHLRPLPILPFQTLITTLRLPAPAQCILAANTLLPLLPTSPPTYDLTPPSLADWATHFLPHTANTHGFVDNAKVSVLLQTALQLVLPEIEAADDDTKVALAEAVQAGVRKRKKKAIGLGKAGGGGVRGDEVVAQGVLEQSAEALEVLVEWVIGDGEGSLDQSAGASGLSVEERNQGVVSSSELSSAPADLSDGEDEMEE